MIKKIKSRKKNTIPLKVKQFVRFNIFKVGDYYENCNYHPCRVTHVDHARDDLSGRSLWDGQIHNCSIRHCVPAKITEEQVLLRMAYRNEWEIAKEKPRETTEEWKTIYNSLPGANQWE